MIEDIGLYFVQGLIDLGKQGIEGREKIVAAIQAIEGDEVDLIEEGLAQLDDVLSDLGVEEEDD